MRTTKEERHNRRATKMVQEEYANNLEANDLKTWKKLFVAETNNESRNAITCHEIDWDEQRHELEYWMVEPYGK
jgi:hypothetical protein